MSKRGRLANREREALRRTAEHAARVLPDDDDDWGDDDHWGVGAAVPSASTDPGAAAADDGVGLTPRQTVQLMRSRDRSDALRALTAARRQVEAAEARRDAAALNARARGATWSMIAYSLGRTPQAAQQRYGGRS